MNLDLGLQGFALLLVPAAVFGVLAHLLLWRRTTRWIGLIAAAGWFVGGLVASEALFGTETSDENLQPWIDGLLFDEALIGGFLVGVATVIVTWLVTRGRSR